MDGLAAMTVRSSVEARLNKIIGESFFKEVLFTEEAIGQFASLVGDTNPVHHSLKGAAAASFDRVVASGTHTLSVMLAAVPDYFKSWGPSVGLGVSVRMLKPVFAGDHAQVEWKISSVTNTPKLNGWVIGLNGSLVRRDGVLAMTGEATTLIWWPRTPDALEQRSQA